MRKGDGDAGSGPTHSGPWSPSWLFYVLDGRFGGGVYKEQIVTRTGRTLTLPPFRTVDATWGISTPVPVRQIARVTLTRQPRGPALQAILPVVEP